MLTFTQYVSFFFSQMRSKQNSLSIKVLGEDSLKTTRNLEKLEAVIFNAVKT